MPGRRQISCGQRCGAAGGGKLHVAGQAAQSQRGGRGIHAQQDKFGFLFLHRQQQAAHIAGRRVYLHCRARRIGAAHALLHLALHGKILHQPIMGSNSSRVSANALKNNRIRIKHTPLPHTVITV